VVEADRDPAAGEVVADGVLPAGQADQTGGVDQAVDLDGRAGLSGWVEMGAGPAERPS
jgi:hypothetical protein